MQVFIVDIVLSFKRFKYFILCSVDVFTRVLKMPKLDSSAHTNFSQLWLRIRRLPGEAGFAKYP